MKRWFAVIGCMLAVAACSDQTQPAAPRPRADLLGQLVIKIPQLSGVVALPSAATNGGGGEAPLIPAPAWPPGTVGSNVVMNQDNSFRPQNETPIAVDPGNPNRLLSGANDYRNGDAQCGVYGSRDGGATWNDVGTGTLVFLPANGDPSTAFGPAGEAYYTCLAFTRVLPLANATSAIVVSRSTDLLTITPRGAVIVTVLGGSDLTFGYFNDKPFTATDTRSGSPHQGRIYVTWTQFKYTRVPTFYVESPILLSYSDDGGATWNGPHAVTTPTLNRDQGSVPAVGPNGEVYVAFENYNTLGSTNQIMVATSLDGGNTFSPPVKVDDVFDIPVRLKNSAFRINSFPSIAACGSGLVHVVWGDYRSGNADVLLSNSADGGQTWDSPIIVNSDQTTADQFFPWIAGAEGGALQVAFLQRDDAPGNRLLNTWLSTSFDNGASFEAQRLVSSGPSDPINDGFLGGFIGDYIGVAASANTAHPAWTDTRGLQCGGCFPNADAVTTTVSFSP
jgi:hypothetical protein